MNARMRCERDGSLHGPAGSGGLQPPFFRMPKATFPIALRVRLRQELQMAASARHSCAVKRHDPLEWETPAGRDRIPAEPGVDARNE